jgi:hypothetical protein
MLSRSPDSSIFLSGLSRLGVPFFCFSLTFFCASIVVTFLLNPDRFPVHIDQRFVTIHALSMEEQSLLQEEQSLLLKKDSFYLESRAPRLAQVRALRSTHPSLGTLFRSLDTVRASFMNGEVSSVLFSDISFDAMSRSLTVKGTIRISSVPVTQLLASFVDALRLALPAYSVLEPEYPPSSFDDISFPFEMTIILPHA